MEKPLKFKQLLMPNPNTNNLYPNYQNKLQPRMKFEPASLKQLYLRHQDAIIKAAAKECKQYLDDEAFMGDNTFPRVEELTGEWYLHCICAKQRDGAVRADVTVNFLGHYPKGCAREEIDDYLGMQAWFDYDQSRDAFVFDCFDTDAI